MGEKSLLQNWQYWMSHCFMVDDSLKKEYENYVNYIGLHV